MTSTGSPQDGLRDGCGFDVAAYALGALEPAEVDEFSTHLASCAMCREELVEFERVVATLPMSVPRHAMPDGLRARVLADVHSEAVTRPERRWVPRLSWGPVPRPAFALAATAMVMIIAVLAAVALTGPGPARMRVYAARVSAATGSARITVTDGHAELTVNHFAAPPPGKIYEVWLSRPHRSPQPTTALFSVTAGGRGDVAVPGSLHGVTSVMVTPEPTGGSRVPTHPPVLRAAIT
ncbi:MAG: anti-sigma factor [Actinomycetota bacterium]|nr:anti-sigma factor [Actinomycetota bacterium]